MSLAIKVLMMVGLVACLTSVAHATAGQATFHSPPYVPSACFGFEDIIGVMIVAVNNGLYENGGACGRMYRVTCTGPTNACTGNSVVVMVVDRCPECNSNEIDLSQEAFAVITNRNSGTINIEYTQADSATEKLRMSE